MNHSLVMYNERYCSILLLNQKCQHGYLQSHVLYWIIDILKRDSSAKIVGELSLILRLSAPGVAI